MNTPSINSEVKMKIEKYIFVKLEAMVKTNVILLIMLIIYCEHFEIIYLKR